MNTEKEETKERESRLGRWGKSGEQIAVVYLYEPKRELAGTTSEDR